MSSSPFCTFEALPQLLAHRATDEGDRTAVTIHGVDYSYRELWTRSGRVLGWLTSSGIRRGDRVALLVRSSIEFIDSWIGMVEMVGSAQPVVAEAAAIGGPSQLSKEDVMIVEVLKEGHQLPESELADWCEGRLESFMRPRCIECGESLPRTETGWVKKYLLRKERSQNVWDAERERARK